MTRKNNGSKTDRQASQGAALEASLDAALTRLERAALDLQARARDAAAAALPVSVPDSASGSAPDSGPDSGPDGEQAEYLARLEAENRTLLHTLERLKGEYENLEARHETLRERTRDLESRTESADRDLDEALDQLDRLMADERLH